MSENIEGNPLILVSSPKTLLEIASFKLALICRRHEFHNIHISCDLRFHIPELNVDNVLKVLLPKHIPKMLNHHIKSVASQLRTWIDFHKGSIFHTYRVDVILDILDCIVYRSDGKICYQSTAENLLASDRLNLEEKYRIACVYCFEKEIDRLWPSVMNTVRISDSIVFDQYVERFQETVPLFAVNYWNMIKNDKYAEEPVLLRCIDMHKLAKIEFYWNFNVRKTSKLSLVEKICQSEICYHDNMKLLMSKLNITEQKHLLTLMPWQLVVLLAVEEVEPCTCSLQVWNHVKDSITNDEFFSILKILWQNAFSSLKKRHYSAVILRKIWITASNHLRDDILNNHVTWFFDELKIPRDFQTYGYDMGFYIDILGNLSPTLRHKLWLENWRKFIGLATVPNLDKLLKLCLTNDEVFSFKNDFMINHTMLNKEFVCFVRTGMYEELLNYLKFCCSDTTHVQEIQQQILVKFRNISFFSEDPQVNFSLNRCIKLNEFINAAFPSTYSADQFKKQFILDNFQYLDTLLVTGNFQDEIRNLTTCLASCNDINELKQSAYRICQDILLNGCFVDFNGGQWESFLKWCAPSENEFLKFKKGLPIDHIFATLLSRVIKGQRQLRLDRRNTILSNSKDVFLPNYISFSKFLRWYCGSDEAANNLKQSVIRDYKKVDVIKAVLREENIDIVIDMLKWFFNYDIDQVMTFYSSFVQTRITERNW